MNPCEGFLDVLSFNGGGELEDKFTSIYWTMKKDLRTPQKKAAFNKVCSNLGKDAPAWVMHIIQIFCATSAITNSDNLVRFEVEGSVDRFIAYVLNYATVHQLTTVDETRPELESFRKIVSGVIRSQAAGSSHSSADSRNLDKLPPEREVNAASIEEYADDFDDEQQATAPPSRPRAPPVMKRQMSVKGMANNPATPVRQEDSSVYEEYEDDFEKNNHSSVFSDQGHAEIPYAGRVAEPVESSNEYADDFVGSALSLPGAGQNGGSVAEYADDFDGGNSEIVTPADTSPASMGRPDGSVGRDSASVNYGADFEGGNSTEELQVPRDAPAVQADNSVMNEYADDFDGGDITAAAEGVEDAHDEEGYFVVTAGAGMVPPGEPLTRDNSDATFMRILQAPVEMALLDRDDSETTFLKNFQNFEEQNKESFEGIDRSAMPVVDAAESDPSMSRHNSERSFLGEFDNFHYKFKSEFDDTAAANAEKNRNIAVQPSYEGDDGFGEFSAAVAVTTPKSMGASVPGLSRFNSERSGGMSSTHPAPLDHTDGLSAEGASVVSAKKLKKTISFVQNVEYNDEDLTIGSKRFEPDVIDAANETQEYKADLEDIIGNMYVNSYMNANTSNEKQILFVEQVVYEDDDLYIGSNEFVKAKNEKDNKAVAGGEKIGLRSGSPASRPPARSIPAVGKILPAKPIAGSTISSSKPAPLPSMKVKESSAASTSKRPVSAQSTRSDAPVPLSSHSILQDPETLKVIRNGIEFDMIVPKKQAPIPLVSNVRPLSSPSRRMESRSAAKKTTSILVRSSPIARPQTAPAPRQPTYTGNIKKPAERAGESNSSLSLQGHEDRFAIKVVRRAAQPLDTGLRRSKSPVKIGANEKAQPPCIDITKVRVRNADDLFELLRRKLGEAARMIGDADIMWRKRLEEALKTQQDYWMDGKRSHEYRALNYRSLRPLSSSEERSPSPSTRGRVSSGTSRVPASKSSFMNENGELFKRSSIPTAHFSSGVLLCKLSSNEIDAAETLQVSLSKPIGTLNNLHQKQALLIKEAFDIAEDMMKQCAIAKYRCEKNRTSVNQKRLEVLSVRSVRVVLGSIEKVNEVCQLLKDNYTKLHMDGSETDNCEEPTAGVPLERNSPPRAQSAPVRRPRIQDLQTAESAGIMAKKTSRRAQSASRGGAGVYTAIGRSTGGISPYKHYTNKEKKTNKENERGKIHMKTSPEEEGEGIYSDDGEFEDPSEDPNLRNHGDRERGRHQIKVAKKRNRGSKHTCALCSKQFYGDVRRIPSCNSLDRDTIELRREEDFLNKMNALNAGDLRDHERKLLRVQYLKRKKMDHTIGVHNKIFCSWSCARMWNNKNCAVQFKYYNNLLIDMADSQQMRLEKA